MNQVADNNSQTPPEGYDPRARALMTRPPESADFAPRRAADFPQTVYRNERQAAQRMHREPVHEEYEESTRSMVSHPLFRGLLQELPPRSAPPTKEWLDRWTQTSRSILDLLYSREPLS